MSYRHIDTLAQEDWFKRPWMILGTGASLDRFNAEDWQDHNIAAIYDAWYACPKCTILFASDSWADERLLYIQNGQASSATYIATRSINANLMHYYHKYQNVVMWDYDCDQANYGVRLFPHIPQYPCSNTSSFVVLWLGTHGVREIKTFGIDGGRGVVSKHVSEQYRIDAMNMNQDFDLENQGVYGHAAHYGIKITRQ